MNQRSFLQSQLIETERLIELAGDHPLMSPGLVHRKSELTAQLENLPPALPEARATLFFAGGPVFGSAGIDAEFAARILDPFVQMVKTQYSVNKHGNIGARGPRRDEAESKLMLTALPRGSFGLELTQQEQPDQETSQQLAEVLVQLSGLIQSAGVSDEAFAAALAGVSERILPSLKSMLKTMSDREADFRLVTAEREFRLGRQVMTQAYERVAETSSEDEEAFIAGVFRGAILDSWRFDFRSDEGEQISGRIGSEVEEERAQRMNQLTNQPCIAHLRVTTVAARNRRPAKRYELLDLTLPDETPGS